MGFTKPLGGREGRAEAPWRVERVCFGLAVALDCFGEETGDIVCVIQSTVHLEVLKAARSNSIHGSIAGVPRTAPVWFVEAIRQRGWCTASQGRAARPGDLVKTRERARRTARTAHGAALGRGVAPGGRDVIRRGPM
jgi:hypothetical protein